MRQYSDRILSVTPKVYIGSGRFQRPYFRNVCYSKSKTFIFHTHYLRESIINAAVKICGRSSWLVLWILPLFGSSRAGCHHHQSETKIRDSVAATPTPITNRERTNEKKSWCVYSIDILLNHNWFKHRNNISIESLWREEREKIRATSVHKLMPLWLDTSLLPFNWSLHEHLVCASNPFRVHLTHTHTQIVSIYPLRAKHIRWTIPRIEVARLGYNAFIYIHSLAELW